MSGGEQIARRSRLRGEALWRLLAGARAPVATASRLALLTQALAALAEGAKAEASKEAELTQEAFLERLRDLLGLAGELAHGFRATRQELVAHYREIKAGLQGNAESRRALVDALAGGTDFIAESEAGRRLAAFWRLADDPRESARRRRAIDSLCTHEFASALQPAERRFLLLFSRCLREESSALVALQCYLTARLRRLLIASGKDSPAPSLRNYPPEGECGNGAAIDGGGSPSAADPPAPDAPLASAPFPEAPEREGATTVEALPDLPAGAGAPLQRAEAPSVDLQAVGGLLAGADIDFRSLKQQLAALLAGREAVTIGEALASYPASQGLGTVLGMLALGSRYGQAQGGELEAIRWQDADAEPRLAEIPRIVFTRERLDELA